MPHHQDIDWEAVRARVAAAHEGAETTDPEPEPESLDDITRRMTGADLNNIARRMFDH